MYLSAGRHGFSLIEAVVAVAILGLACVAVSGVLSATLHAERSLERRRHLDAVLAAEGERLAALPYIPPGITHAVQPKTRRPAGAITLRPSQEPQERPDGYEAGQQPALAVDPAKGHASHHGQPGERQEDR